MTTSKTKGILPNMAAGIPILTEQEWTDLRATSAALGSIKLACAHHGVPYEAAKKRAQREGWATPKRLATASRQARSAEKAAVVAAQPMQQPSKPAKYTPKRLVPSVPSAALTLEGGHIEAGKRGRLAASVLAAKGLEHLSKQDPANILKSARAAKDLNEVSAKAGGWSEEGSGAKVTLNIAVMGSSLPDSVKGNYIFPDDEPDLPVADAKEVAPDCE